MNWYFSGASWLYRLDVYFDWIVCCGVMWDRQTDRQTGWWWWWALGLASERMQPDNFPAFLARSGSQHQPDLISSSRLCLWVCLATQTEAVGSVGALDWDELSEWRNTRMCGKFVKIWRQMSWCRCWSSSPLTFVILLPPCGHVETGANIGAHCG